MPNLPNCLTLSRFVLTAIFTWLLCADPTPVSNPSTYKVLAFFAFFIGALTDYLDGYIARKYNLISNFGKLMDPLADKVLVSAAFIYLSVVNLCPFWVTILIIAREFLVTGIRQLAVEQGQVIAADKFGKWKTVLQLCFCGICLLSIAFGQGAPTPLNYLTSGKLSVYLTAFFLWSSFALTFISGFNYCWKARHLFR